ncbi:hypothetical protein EUTSA_v10000586mg [Eutrema salsugineum]|uniref:Uncharacterized protein n=1 Tax=Eutrema salsugineum TaxID=72664 RepID=V4L860_EUTSA|nr:hypothetical protein EUTSA_v10000586mg [Eutrema salsugineum]
MWEPGGIATEHDKWKGLEKCYKDGKSMRLMHRLSSILRGYGKVTELTPESSIMDIETQEVVDYVSAVVEQIGYVPREVEMPQKFSVVTKLDCADQMLKGLLRTRKRKQKWSKTWKYKFKDNSEAHKSTDGTTLLLKHGVVILVTSSKVISLPLDEDNQLLLDGIGENNKVLLEKFGSIYSYYKAYLPLESMYVDFVGGKTPGEEPLVASEKMQSRLVYDKGKHALMNIEAGNKKGSERVLLEPFEFQSRRRNGVLRILVGLISEAKGHAGHDEVFNVPDLLRNRTLLVVGLRQLTFARMKFHLKHKWRSKFRMVVLLECCRLIPTFHLFDGLHATVLKSVEADAKKRKNDFLKDGKVILVLVTKEREVGTADGYISELEINQVDRRGEEEFVSLDENTHQLSYLVSDYGDGDFMRLRVVGFYSTSLKLLYGSLPRPPDFKTIKKSFQRLGKLEKDPKLLFLKNHKLLHPGFWTHYNDLKQFSTEPPSSSGLDYFTWLIDIWNRAINCDCESGHTHSGTLYIAHSIDGFPASIISVTVLQLYLLFKTEADNFEDLLISGKMKLDNAHIFSYMLCVVMLYIMRIKHGFEWLSGLVPKLEVTTEKCYFFYPTSTTTAILLLQSPFVENSAKKKVNHHNKAFITVFVHWKVHPPDQVALTFHQIHQGASNLSSLRTRMLSTREYCYRIIPYPLVYLGLVVILITVCNSGS